MSDEQNKQRTQEVFDVITKNAALIATFKDVTDTGAGLKRVNGQFTEDICLVITVEKKKPLDELEPDQVIPSSIDGMAVDVVSKPHPIKRSLKLPVEEAANQNKYRPLVGGCQISNGIEEDGLVEVGTLGCMIYLTYPSNDWIGMMSNDHVIYANGAQKYQEIGQPMLTTTSVAGKAIFGAEVPDQVDYAVADIAEGVEVTNDVLEIGTLKGFGNAFVRQEVRKYGITTALTTGQVTYVGYYIIKPLNVYVYTGITIYEGWPDIIYRGRFSDKGDSGSVIVNNDNLVVGLLWGGELDPMTDATWANDQRRLRTDYGDFDIPVPTNFQIQQIFSDTARLEQYSALLQQSERGRQLLQAFTDNAPECIRLAHEQRECKLAWQRSKGPAFMSIRKGLGTDTPFVLKRSIDGVAIEDMITKMAGVFKTHGSASLAAAIEDHGEDILAAVSKSTTLEEVIDYFVKG